MQSNLAKIATTLSLVCLASRISAKDKMEVVYEWKIVDFDYPSADARQAAVDNGEFVPENNNPLGLEIFRDRLFVTVPRWRAGVAASLNYINMTEDPKGSPILRPYPNWDFHKFIDGHPPTIVSPYRVRADACQRLWVLDKGFEGQNQLRQPRVLIFDLNVDRLLRIYTIPKEQSGRPFFANVAVDDHDCEDTYAYFADISGSSDHTPGLVVYSYKENQSWLVRHEYFKPNPEATEMHLSGLTYVWHDGIFGLSLSAPDEEGYCTLYFHPMCDFDEYSVSTKVLRDRDAVQNGSLDDKFKRLGTRGPKGQSGASFLDQNSKVLFFNLIHLNATGCWKTTSPSFDEKYQGKVFQSNETLVFPNDIKVNGGNVWVLSDKLPTFMYSTLNYTDTNFRILRGRIDDVVEDTPCA